MDESEDWIFGRWQTDQRMLLVRSRQLGRGFSFRTRPERLTVIWTHRESDSGGGLTFDEVKALERFEVRLHNHCESTGNAVLCLVLVDLDSSQYVLYAKDAASFMLSLQEVPCEAEPYPIRIHHEHDPEGALHRFFAAKLAAH